MKIYHLFLLICLSLLFFQCAKKDTMECLPTSEGYPLNGCYIGTRTAEWERITVETQDGLIDTSYTTHNDTVRDFLLIIKNGNYSTTPDFSFSNPIRSEKDNLYFSSIGCFPPIGDKHINSLGRQKFTLKEGVLELRSTLNWNERTETGLRYSKGSVLYRLERQ